MPWQVVHVLPLIFLAVLANPFPSIMAIQFVQPTVNS